MPDVNPKETNSLFPAQVRSFLRLKRVHPNNHDVSTQVFCVGEDLISNGRCKTLLQLSFEGWILAPWSGVPNHAVAIDQDNRR
jgi:hypothetical protein